MTVETSAQALIRISAQACAGPEGIMEQEQEYLTALGTAATYHIGSDSMEMRIAERSIVASFQIVKYTQNLITDRRKSNGSTNRMEIR